MHICTHARFPQQTGSSAIRARLLATGLEQLHSSALWRADLRGVLCWANHERVWPALRACMEMAVSWVLGPASVSPLRGAHSICCIAVHGVWCSACIVRGCARPVSAVPTGNWGDFHVVTGVVSERRCWCWRPSLPPASSSLRRHSPCDSRNRAAAAPPPPPPPTRVLALISPRSPSLARPAAPAIANPPAGHLHPIKAHDCQLISHLSTLSATTPTKPAPRLRRRCRTQSRDHAPSEHGASG